MGTGIIMLCVDLTVKFTCVVREREVPEQTVVCTCIYCIRQVESCFSTVSDISNILSGVTGLGVETKCA